MGETEGSISLAGHLVLVSSCVLVIVGEHFQHQKNTVLNSRGHKKDKKIDWNTSINKRFKIS